MHENTKSEILNNLACGDHKSAAGFVRHNLCEIEKACARAGVKKTYQALVDSGFLKIGFNTFELTLTRERKKRRLNKSNVSNIDISTRKVDCPDSSTTVGNIQMLKAIRSDINLEPYRNN